MNVAGGLFDATIDLHFIVYGPECARTFVTLRLRMINCVRVTST